MVNALEGYAQASVRAPVGMPSSPPVDIGDALVALERDRTRAERERHKNAFGHTASAADAGFTGDLLTAGVEMVWALIKTRSH
ncbi:hypothetical protein D3C71_2059090 [compost metagenome]